ncbi:unnamed protein product [Didymodactylos carnosus]|uniref:DUF4550 domain-containing protein n=1 Tax=Didymodactylos carnosus TaxID=1234261 RepID=A0A8S2GPP5_9BILA|nr:unnamed protein product [Didymodactylos carnosus]CAF3542549.1 unnamed protein product [Didymodactylos carnosus]
MGKCVVGEVQQHCEPTIFDRSSVINTGAALSVATDSKVQGYYRFEYALTPDDTNLTSCDIAVFKNVAKIYPDNNEPRIVSTWEDDDNNIWITWTHNHTIELDRERLLKFVNHKIIVKIWDGKEYCLPRTKLDRPKLIRYPASSTTDDDKNSPKTIVQRVAQNYTKWLPKPLLYKLKRKLPVEIPLPSLSLQQTIRDIESQITPTEQQIEVSVIEKTTPELPIESADNIANEKNSVKKTKRSTSKSTTRAADDSETKFSKVKPTKHVDEKREKGAIQIIFPSKLLFVGSKEITCRIDDKTPQAIKDCFVNLSIDDFDVLSEHLATEYNPLSLKICHVVNMPSTPLSFKELRKQCEPVYCSYELFDQQEYRTTSKSHQRNIYWDDIYVCFMNLINETSLAKFRNSPIIYIELHDRDEKANIRKSGSSVFGTEVADESIGHVSAVIAKLTIHNPFESRGKPWFPYGTVKLDLSELLLGQTSLECFIPVVPCHAPDIISRTTNAKRIYGVPGAVDTGKYLPIQQGHFLEHGTQMKIVVRLAKPLVNLQLTQLQRSVIATPMTPFTRTVFVFDYNNLEFLSVIETNIHCINAKALELDVYPKNVQAAALSTYKLTEIQRKSLDLNIITGFHLFDDEHHIFVLEGLRDKGIEHLYEQLSKSENQKVDISYDSSLTFDERIYAKLNVDLTRIKLHRPLKEIVQQPLLYVRDMVPKESFEALRRLHEMVKMHNLRSSVKHNLFPTADMIVSLSKEFGVPITQKEFEAFSSYKPYSHNHKKEQSFSPTTATTMFNKNQDNDDDVDITSSKKQNFVEKNIQQIKDASSRNREHRIRENDQILFVAEGPVFHYSTQKLNTTEKALDQIRNYLTENYRSSSFSYNPDHRSGTFSPVLEQSNKDTFESLLRSDSKMSADVNWHYPGYKSSVDSNIHSRTPDPARLDELAKPPESWYKQNNNETKVRESFPWMARKDDFDLWKRHIPSPILNTTASITSEQSRESRSLSKLQQFVVDDERMKFLRSSPRTEMTIQGRLAASQLDKLKGLLKDDPKKKGFMAPKSFYRKLERNKSRSVIPHRSTQSAPLQRTFLRSQTNEDFYDEINDKRRYNLSVQSVETRSFRTLPLTVA